MYKYAPNEFSFRAQLKNFVIASRLVRRGNLVEMKRHIFLRPISFYECTALQKLSVLDFNATFPFPQVFGLRRLRGNPPCSLWLQSVHWTNCFTRRAHITVPPCKGTHGDRVAGDNTRSRHNLRHFSYCATSPAWRLAQHNATHSRTTVKSDARYGRRLAAPIPSSK